MDQPEKVSRTLKDFGPPQVPQPVLAAGRLETKAEDVALGFGSSGIYGFRSRHPFWYGLIAFVVGGAAAGLGVLSTYGSWVFLGTNLVGFFYEVVAGGLVGGLVGLALAFGYTSVLRPVVRRRAG